MRRIFADSYYFIALLNLGDDGHERVAQILTSLKDCEMTTTTWILVELADALCRNELARKRVGEFLELLPLQKQVMVVPAVLEDYKTGLALFRQRPDKAWSLTDCISFVIMEREGALPRP